MTKQRDYPIYKGRHALGFVWENFGPMHIDRCQAVAARLADHNVFGIELFEASSAYEWDRTETSTFKKVTLFSNSGGRPGLFTRAFAIFRAARKAKITHIFFCHYNRPEVTLVAWLLRLSGVRLFVMSCSKYDDRPRKAWTEAMKTLALTPFHGALSSGIRARDYLRYLGIDPRYIHGEYNTLSVKRMRRQIDFQDDCAAVPFAKRDFVAVARLVPKKNLSMLLDAFSKYRADNPKGRRLVICGSGPLETELKAKAKSLGIAQAVDFTGFVQTDVVSGYLSKSLALLLPSIEEQFGNVVIEAQAFGLPVIVADNCGARDRLVRAGVNGFVIEPDNPEGLAYFMALLAQDQRLWERMSAAATVAAELGDDERFAEGVEALVNGEIAR